MMDMNQFVDETFFMAYEGDDSGLWDVYFTAKRIYGEIAQEDLIMYSKKAILYLVNQGWIQLNWVKEPLAVVMPMEQDEVMKALSETKYWEPPEKDAISIRFIATPEGDKAYEERYLN